ncbi:hypothetical protein WR25_04384 [Diploscapter pachys]|uniref:GB1/RHD3-type G domain-containing protein n=1 Tax=Diploscapter pachys TaxID=2018661 RepID=A0A2A2JHL0_9BILA|nr:hypothetical protein WR25_04384 [Diploscapter pachys]
MAAGYAAPIVELHEGSKNNYKLNQKELEKTLGRADIAGKKVSPLFIWITNLCFQIALISIAGAFRKGKSFLLNFFVTYLEYLHKGGKGEWFDETTVLDKFNWRGGADRDTNGIFIWSVPYMLEDQNGEEVVVFLMDTQGTFDHQSTVQDCATIFALSTLLSSVQIYNLSTQIQEDDLNNLRLFTEYAQLNKHEKHQRAPFQKLLFLVRDWPNSDQYEYGYEGGKEYLEKLLKTTPKQKKELKVLRENVKSSFESLEAFLMPYPGLRIARNNSEKFLGKVEEAFSEQLGILVPSIFKGDSLEVKKIDGKEITCREMVELFKELMKIFNSDDLPEPKTILEATADAVNLVAEQMAREAYDKHMKENFTSSLVDISTLLSLHQAAETQALGVFSARPKLGEESAAKANKDNLAKYFAARHEEYKRTVQQNIRVEEEKKKVEIERKRIAAEQEIERQRIKAEEERIRRERAENERRQREEQARIQREREELARQRREDGERRRQYSTPSYYCSGEGYSPSYSVRSFGDGSGRVREETFLRYGKPVTAYHDGRHFCKKPSDWDGSLRPPILSKFIPFMDAGPLAPVLSVAGYGIRKLVRLGHAHCV